MGKANGQQFFMLVPVNTEKHHCHVYEVKITTVELWVSKIKSMVADVLKTTSLLLSVDVQIYASCTQMEYN